MPCGKALGGAACGPSVGLSKPDLMRKADSLAGISPVPGGINQT